MQKHTQGNAESQGRVQNHTWENAESHDRMQNHTLIVVGQFHLACVAAYVAVVSSATMHISYVRISRSFAYWEYAQTTTCIDQTPSEWFAEQASGKQQQQGRNRRRWQESPPTSHGQRPVSYAAVRWA